MDVKNQIVFLLIIMLSGKLQATNDTEEHKLRTKLFSGYSKSIRPVMDPSQPINVSFALKLNKIVDVDLKSQLLIVDAHVIQKWTNPFLTWNESQFGGVHTIHLSPSDVWVPDVVLYNNGDDKVALAGSLEKFKTRVIVESNGMNTWMSPAQFKSSCDVHVEYFPFDTQVCEMTFGSWTYDDRLLQMQLEPHEKIFTEKYVPNGDWNMTDLELFRQAIKYSCCPYTFSDVTYKFFFQRKILYHTFYLILPCILIATLILINFVTPAASGERIGLCTTILLAMSVYLLIVADSLPEESDHLPLLGIYYIVTMIFVTTAVVATAVVLRCHHATGKPPRWLLRLLKIDSDELKAKTVVINEKGNDTVEMEEKNLLSAKNTLSEEEEEKKNRKAWDKVCQKLDNIFFVLFFIISLLTALGIFLQAA